MRTILLTFCMFITLSRPLVSQTSPNPGFEVSIPPIETRVGESFEIALRLDSAEPIQVLAIRLQTSPSLIRLSSWSFGAGLTGYFEDNGEPPVCDIIIYPDGSGMFSVMAFSVPYAVDHYGSDWLRVRYEVAATGPRSSCLFLQSDTEDYEPGNVSRLNLLIAAATRKCVPLLIRPSMKFQRGDADGNGSAEITDAIRVLHYLFLGAQEPSCLDAADTDDDGQVSVGDSILLLRALFLTNGGPPSGCASDPTPDNLPPCEGSSC